MNFKLIDVVNAATSTVALVIGSSIFLQILANKSVALFERYRGLTGEYRTEKDNQARRNDLEDQITLYYTRCHSIRLATTIVTLAVLCFLATIVIASLSVMFPNSNALKVTGAIVLVTGLIGVAAGAIIELRENGLGGRAVDSEVHDFPNLPKRQI